MTGFKFAAIGLDHRHIYHQVGQLLERGCECVGWCTEGEPGTLEGFIKRFPDLPRVQNQRELLDDPEIKLVVSAGVPSERSALAIDAMRAGKDVMVDKPGVTNLGALEIIKKTHAETGRIWSVNFSERFETRSTAKALELVRAGAIGKVVQTLGMGPHRLNKPTRPDWFFERNKYGGILGDIASHQIDQFLMFTGSTDAEIMSASIGNFANPETPELEDFGQVLLKSDRATGYIRVDWFTPDGLPTWGDGRLTILGAEGYIELRKYVDIAGRPGTDHLFLVNGEATQYVDCSDVELPYYSNLVADVLNRTETAMPQTHCFKVMELAIQAQIQAERLA
ncbi:MAG: Gfo/Idh/MocA family oxidoreductase [Pseudomonadota bacterium]